MREGGWRRLEQSMFRALPNYSDVMADVFDWTVRSRMRGGSHQHQPRSQRAEGAVVGRGFARTQRTGRPERRVWELIATIQSSRRSSPGLAGLLRFGFAREVATPSRRSRTNSNVHYGPLHSLTEMGVCNVLRVFHFTCYECVCEGGNDIIVLFFSIIF